MRNQCVKTKVGIFSHAFDCFYHAGQEECDCGSSKSNAPQIDRGDEIFVYDRLDVTERTSLFIALAKTGLTTFYVPTADAEVYFDVVESSAPASKAA